MPQANQGRGYEKTENLFGIEGDPVADLGPGAVEGGSAVNDQFSDEVLGKALEAA